MVKGSLRDRACLPHSTLKVRNSSQPRISKRYRAEKSNEIKETKERDEDESF